MNGCAQLCYLSKTYKKVGNTLRKRQIHKYVLITECVPSCANFTQGCHGEISPLLYVIMLQMFCKDSFNNSIHNSYKRAILLQNLCVRKIPTLENISLTLSTPQKQSYQRTLFDFTFSKASKNNQNKNDKIMQRGSLNISAIRRGYKILDFENV